MALAAQLTPAASMAATVLAAGLMLSEGLRSKRLALRPRRHDGRRLRVPRRFRRG
jgi:hypothetical protein